MSDTINLDPVEESLDARNLGPLIERWLSSLEVLSVTHDCYKCRLAHFITWWEAVGPTVEWRLTRSLLQSFEVHLRTKPTERFGRPMTYHSRHGLTRALRSMFRWAAETGKTSKNYGEWVPWPAGAAPKRKAVTVEQLARLMQAAATSRQPLRDQAIIAFFIGTGCRKSEVAGLAVEDLTLRADGSGTAHVIGKRTSANRHGQRTISFDASTGRWLIRYMDDYCVHAGPLWLNNDGDTFSHQSIYLMVKRTIRRAALADQIQGPHDLRRAFATILGRLHPNNPSWHDMIRRQLGHKHYSQTAEYILFDADDIQLASPLDRGEVQP